MCTAHQDKPIEYYCMECSKSACMDCMIISRREQCRNHTLVPARDRVCVYVKSICTHVIHIQTSINFLYSLYLQQREAFIIYYIILTGFFQHAEISEKMKNLAPSVDETLRRLSKTAVVCSTFLLHSRVFLILISYSDVVDNYSNLFQDIGYLLKKFDNSISSECDVHKMITSVQNHYCKLRAMIQKHEMETLNRLHNLKNEQRDSLLKAKEDVVKNIKEVQTTINKMSAVFNAQNISQVKCAF